MDAFRFASRFRPSLASFALPPMTGTAQILSILSVLLLSTEISPAQSGSERLSSRLQTIRSQFKLAGISVAAVKDGNIVAVGSAGLADVGRSVAVTESTMYRIASISKTVTATALMQLYEQGKFSLDDDVSPSLGFSLRNPSYPDVPITFRMLLSHTSSVQDGTGYDGFLSASIGSNPPPIASVLVPGGSFFTSNIWRANRPGTYFAYSNLGFGIVGTLVEAISRERFDLYCLNHILKPLGIEGSFSVADLMNIRNLAVLYRTSGGTWVPQADNYGGVKPAQRDLSAYVIGSNAVAFGPQGGLRISAKDLAVFMLARMNGGEYQGVRILRDSTARLMNQPVWTYNGSNGDTYYGLFRKWGLGTQITTNAPMGDIVVPGRTMAGHAGEAYGLISDAYFELTKNEIGIVFITNGRDGSYRAGSTSAFYDVEETVFAETYALINEIVSGVEVQSPLSPSGFRLEQNFPNPFNPSTVLSYRLSSTSAVRLNITNVLGQVVAQLVDETQSPGRHQVRWNAAAFPSGVYFCCLHADGRYEMKKMILTR